MSAAPELKYSFNDYLKIESSGDKRYEFYDGELFEVEDASIDHGRISMNTSSSIAPHLENCKCEIFAANLKVHVKTNSLTSYPDLIIICGEIETLKGYKDIVTNPAVLFEVVSPSTGDYDHGKKFQLYRALPSLQEYILISSMKILVEKFTKQKNGFWTLIEHKSLQDQFTIESCNVNLFLASVYRNVS